MPTGDMLVTVPTNDTLGFQMVLQSALIEPEP